MMWSMWLVDDVETIQNRPLDNVHGDVGKDGLE